MFTAVLLTYLLLPVLSGLVAWTIAQLLRTDDTGGPPPPFLPELPRAPAPVRPRFARRAEDRQSHSLSVVARRSTPAVPRH